MGFNEKVEQSQLVRRVWRAVRSSHSQRRLLPVNSDNLMTPSYLPKDGDRPPLDGFSRRQSNTRAPAMQRTRAPSPGLPSRICHLLQHTEAPPPDAGVED